MGAMQVVPLVAFGALLATPADLESPLPHGYPSIDALRENGWLPIPRDPLPFPSIGAVGHLNPGAGFGE